MSDDPSTPHAAFPIPHGPWRIEAQREVYRDPWVRVRRDEVIRPDGQPGSYCVVHLKPGICVVAVDHQGRVHLTEEFHYGVGRITIEAVSGGIDDEEDPAEAARRELAEELGIVAARWTDLGVTDPFTANVVSPTRMYLAEQLEFGPSESEGTEIIRPHVLSLEDAVGAVLECRITHAPSCLAILKAGRLIESRGR